jgi:uncharacterized membrane protein YhaH (DUF805 family)
MADPRPAFGRLSGNAFGGVVLLTAQFLFGMALNLFITLPRSHPGANPGEYFSGSLQSVVWALGSGIWLLLIHVIVALLILANAIALVVQAIRERRRSAIVLAVFGLLGVVFAGFNGASFLDFNFDFSSMLMSAGFALALLCDVALVINGLVQRGDFRRRAEQDNMVESRV